MKKIFRYITAAVILGLVFTYYIVSMHSYSKKELQKNDKRKNIESKLLLSSDDIIRDDFFYPNGDAVFDINIETKTVLIVPHSDIFVTLSRKLKLDGEKLERIEFDFEYLYELSGNNNPHKDAGAVILLLSKNGYRSLDTTSKNKECTMISDKWHNCHYTIEIPGSPVAAIVRFGATSYYKKVMFKNIKLKSFR